MVFVIGPSSNTHSIQKHFRASLNEQLSQVTHTFSEELDELFICLDTIRHLEIVSHY
jgi:hypothetical protein